MKSPVDLLDSLLQWLAFFVRTTVEIVHQFGVWVRHLTLREILASPAFPIVIVVLAMLFFYRKERAMGTIVLVILAGLYLVYYLMPDFQTEWKGVFSFIVALVLPSVAAIYLLLIKD